MNILYREDLRNQLIRGEIKPVYLKSAPLANANNPRLEKLVEQMLSLTKSMNDAKVAQMKEGIERQIAATDRQIDTLVYELYGLTEDEIKIVEDANE